MVTHDADLDQAQLSRRTLVQRLTAAGFTAPVIASILGGDAIAQDATPEAAPALAAEANEDLREVFDLDDRLIQYDPFNYGTPLDAVEGFIVPNDQFFVRNNSTVPAIDPAAWRLNITGLVDTPQELSLEDIQGMETVTFTSFLECSGNSRGFFEPNAAGTQWGNTAIGNAEWTGTRLGPILETAGIQDGAVEIISQGGDFAEMQRGLPLSDAMARDTMLVWEMNGEPLPVVHGGPVRLFVPGWGGIASTKWVVGIEVIDYVFDGQLNSDSYTITDAFENVLRPVREMPVKAVIATPTNGAAVEAGQQSITGFAWSGWGGIELVEVSTDGGATWSEAQIVEEDGPMAWVRFEAAWEAEPGQTVLYARATDELGMTQPPTVEWNARGYYYNAIFDVEVTVS
ncbi:MAG: sulfite oxidase [Thermomicrobiales bacterium]|jgi:DMSO/TMAO reductase YedYZ molybdopterin-dependent catalytic subunit